MADFLVFVGRSLGLRWRKAPSLRRDVEDRLLLLRHLLLDV
ncbi:MAG TPA: hypothetical protein VET51_01050 [Burkholderiales bacterium]|nr:hypothetical protein [Burkholderiales bacterium]